MEDKEDGALRWWERRARDVTRSLRRTEPNVFVSSTRPSQGQTLAVVVSVDPPRNPITMLQRSIRRMSGGDLVSVTFDGKRIPSHHWSNRQRGVAAEEGGAMTYRTLVALTPLDRPGGKELKVRVWDRRYRDVRVRCDVRHKEFLTQHIWLPKKKCKLKQTNKEKDKVSAWRSTESPRQLWSGPMMLPSAGVVSTKYGLRRYYNGVFARNYFHEGVDYACARGSLVRCPAGGRVILAGEEAKGFPVRGNCLGIDHGQGVKSMMMHLDKVIVRRGARVSKGQVIATVGDTGVATGPHLHWGLFVHGKCCDPEMWLANPQQGDGQQSQNTFLW